MALEIIDTTRILVIDTIRILGAQNQNVNFINLLTVSISSDTVIQQLTKYKKRRYRFVLENLLFSSSFKNDTEVIIVSSEGLSNAKEALINSKLHNVLGVCYLSELKDWAEIKGQSKRSQAIFIYLFIKTLFIVGTYNSFR